MVSHQGECGSGADADSSWPFAGNALLDTEQCLKDFSTYLAALPTFQGDIVSADIAINNLEQRSLSSTGRTDKTLFCLFAGTDNAVDADKVAFEMNCATLKFDPFLLAYSYAYLCLTAWRLLHFLRSLRTFDANRLCEQLTFDIPLMYCCLRLPLLGVLLCMALSRIMITSTWQAPTKTRRSVHFYRLASRIPPRTSSEQSSRVQLPPTSVTKTAPMLQSPAPTHARLDGYAMISVF